MRLYETIHNLESSSIKLLQPLPLSSVNKSRHIRTPRSVIRDRSRCIRFIFLKTEDTENDEMKNERQD